MDVQGGGGGGAPSADFDQKLQIFCYSSPAKDQVITGTKHPRNASSSRVSITAKDPSCSRVPDTNLGTPNRHTKTRANLLFFLFLSRFFFRALTLKVKLAHSLSSKRRIRWNSRELGRASFWFLVHRGCCMRLAGKKRKKKTV